MWVDVRVVFKDWNITTIEETIEAFDTSVALAMVAERMKEDHPDGGYNITVKESKY